MKVNEIRYYPHNGCFRLINMHHNGNTYAYCRSNYSEETFEVYFNKNGKPEDGHYYSKSYKLHNGDKFPTKYQKEFDFLKNEFDSTDWEALYVTNVLAGTN